MTADVVEPRKRIVVGIDGSDGSKEALRWAARLADGRNEIEAIIAWDYPTNYGWSAVGIGWQPDVDAAKILEESLDEVFAEHRPVNLVTRVLQGHPRDILIEASAGAEMVVVGSRGHGGFAGLLIGSVSGAVAEHAECPVLVVHPAKR